MSLTKAGKNDFCMWIIQMLIENKVVIEAANTLVLIDTDGYVDQNEALKVAYIAEIGKGSALNQAKLRQTKVANAKLKAFYIASSATADSVCAHLGAEHELTHLIRQKRDSMSNVANRGKREVKS